MPETRIPYDAIYKNLFSNPAMVADLVCRFAPEIAPELDLSSLRRGPETHISKRLEERFNDIVWTLKGRTTGFLVLMSFSTISSVHGAADAGLYGAAAP